MIRAVIVDDESNSRSVLKKIIQEFCIDIVVVGEAEDIHPAYSLIAKESPDIVFLDIEMPSGTGIDLLDLFKEINFEVVFITAYNDYAIQAIDFNCLSYILKPVSVQKVINAVEKAKLAIKEKQSKIKINNLLYNYKQESFSKNERIALPTLEGFQLVKVSDIICLEADGNYTLIYTKNESIKILCSKNLKEFETLLKEYSFIRVHRKHIINPDYILKYIRGEGGHVEMKNNMIVPVSKRKKNEFLNQLKRV